MGQNFISYIKAISVSIIKLWPIFFNLLIETVWVVICLIFLLEKLYVTLYTKRNSKHVPLASVSPIFNFTILFHLFF